VPDVRRKVKFSVNKNMNTDTASLSLRAHVSLRKEIPYFYNTVELHLPGIISTARYAENPDNWIFLSK